MINYKWLGIPGVAEQFIPIPVCRSLLESECGCSRTRTGKFPPDSIWQMIIKQTPGFFKI
jgi:hypothetical protein